MKRSGTGKRQYLLCYTLAFFFLAAACFFWFALRGKSMIWSGKVGSLDGISQHYTALSYYGTYLRTVLRTFLSTGRIVFPAFDASIGAGGDILTTLHYYVIGDPLTLFSAVVPKYYTEYLYEVLIVVRLYLAGLSFTLFVDHIRPGNRFYTAVGALAYAFSGYALFAAVRHPYFANPMIYLPLMLLGCEHVFEGRKPWLFIASVCLAAISNFYFFYMLVLLTVLYAAIRMFSFIEKPYLKNAWRYIWRFFAYGGIGVLCGGIIFFPVVAAQLGSARADFSTAVPLFYNLRYYERFLFDYVSGVSGGSWTIVTHTPLVFCGIVILWMTRRRKMLKTFHVLLTALLLIPFFGWVFNGTSYVSNRWCWGYSLLLCATLSIVLPELTRFSKKQWMIFCAVCAVYGGWGMIRLSVDGFSVAIGPLLTVLTPLLLAAVFFFLRRRAQFPLYLRRAVLFVTVVGVGTLAMVRYNHGYLDQFTPAGKAADNVETEQALPLKEKEDGSFWRYENYNYTSSAPMNTTLLTGLHGTGCYFSLTAPAWSDLLASMHHSETMPQRTTSLQGRTVLCALANVRYYTGRHYLREGFLPYGYNATPLFLKDLPNFELYSAYSRKDTPEKVTYGYYENTLALPFGYTYSRAVSRTEFETLTPAQKQRTLLTSAVLDDPSDLSAGMLCREDLTLPFTVECSKNVRQVQGGFISTKKNAEIKLTLQNSQAGRETYLNFAGLCFRQQDPVERAKTTGSWETLSAQKRAALEKRAERFIQTGKSHITVRTLDTRQSMEVYSERYNYYGGPVDVAINLGYHEKAPVTVVLILQKPGVYSFDDMSVEQIPMDDVAASLNTLGEEHLENTVWETDSLRGDIAVSSEKLLCLSLPYSKGWSARVDGKKADLLKTDIAFMGLRLSPGRHVVELAYRTPYLTHGALMTLAGVLIWIVMIVYQKRKEARSK